MAAGLLMISPVVAAETITYTYDAKGRLVKVKRTGTVNNNVIVHSVGTFADGREFDSSVARGEPATFPLNRVIDGWQEGVQLMGIGDKVEFAIPWQLAYGPVGKGPIPGGATLLFTVELLGIEPAG